MVRIAGYSRVSTVMQADVVEGSLDNQKQKIDDYIKYRYKDGVKVTHYSDTKSGKNTDRQELQKMLSNIGNIDVVVISDLSRISRSLKDMVSITERLKSANVQLVSLKEGLDTSSAMGQFGLKLITLINELEREQTAERLKSGIMERAKRGVRAEGKTIYGYKRVRNNGSIGYDIIESEADCIRMAYRTYVETASIPETKRVLNSAGYRTRDKQKFQYTSINKLLHNKAYYGEGSFLGITSDNAYPPIISKETWEEADLLLTMNNSRKTSVKRGGGNFLLRGILYCSCGTRMHTNVLKGRNYGYYRCASCGKLIKSTDVEPLITIRLSEYVREHPDVLQAGLETIKEQIEQEVRTLKKKISHIEKERKGLVKQQMELIKALSNATQKNKDSINKQLETINRDINRLTDRMHIDYIQQQEHKLHLLEQEDIEELAEYGISITTPPEDISGMDIDALATVLRKAYKQVTLMDDGNVQVMCNDISLGNNTDIVTKIVYNIYNGKINTLRAVVNI